MSSSLFSEAASRSLGVSSDSGPIFRVSQFIVEVKLSILADLILTQLNVKQLSSCSQLSRAKAASAASRIPFANLASPVASV